MPSVYSVVRKYQEILSTKVDLALSRGKPTFGEIGVPNRFFCIFLVKDNNLFIDFLQETGLIKSEMMCDKCNVKMTFTVRKTVPEGFWWVCKERREGKPCASSRTIRHDSWFCNSKLKMLEIFLITYEILRGAKTSALEEEYSFCSNVLAYWREAINKQILDYMQLQSQMIGGVGKTVELCESKLGKRYNRGDAIDNQWVIGGYEKGSGKVFIVTIPDGSATTIIKSIKEWIKPETIVCSDDWKSYNGYWKDGFTHLTYDHNLSFRDPSSNFQTEGSIWKSIKSTVPSNNCKIEFQLYLAAYLFRKSCFEQQNDVFTTFLEIIREVKFEELQPNKKIKCSIEVSENANITNI